VGHNTWKQMGGWMSDQLPGVIIIVLSGRTRTGRDVRDHNPLCPGVIVTKPVHRVCKSLAVACTTLLEDTRLGESGRLFLMGGAGLINLAMSSIYDGLVLRVIRNRFPFHARLDEGWTKRISQVSSAYTLTATHIFGIDDDNIVSELYIRTTNRPTGPLELGVENTPSPYSRLHHVPRSGVVLTGFTNWPGTDSEFGTCTYMINQLKDIGRGTVLCCGGNTYTRLVATYLFVNRHVQHLHYVFPCAHIVTRTDFDSLQPDGKLGREAFAYLQHEIHVLQQTDECSTQKGAPWLTGWFGDFNESFDIQHAINMGATYEICDGFEESYNVLCTYSHMIMFTNDEKPSRELLKGTDLRIWDGAIAGCTKSLVSVPLKAGLVNEINRETVDYNENTQAVDCESDFEEFVPAYVKQPAHDRLREKLWPKPWTRSPSTTSDVGKKDMARYAARAVEAATIKASEASAAAAIARNELAKAITRATIAAREAREATTVDAEPDQCNEKKMWQVCTCMEYGHEMHCDVCREHEEKGGKGCVCMQEFYKGPGIGSSNCNE
jgi:dihydrofolate reductase